VLAKGGSVSAAAGAVGISRVTAYALKNRNPEFAKLWEEAKETAADRLEDFARAVGTEGWLEPVYQGGELVGYKRRFSVPVLLTLLRANRPDKFATKTVDDIAPPEPPPVVEDEVDLSFDDDGGDSDAEA